MDKFRNLQTEIEEIIQKIDSQIKDKKERTICLNDEETKCRIDELENQINEMKSQKYSLQLVANKNILIYFIKKNIKEFIKSNKESIRDKNWASIILNTIIVLCLVYAMATFLFNPMLMLMMPYIVLILLYPDIKEMLKLRGLKKEHTVSELNDEIAKLESAKALEKENLAQYKVEMEEIEKSIKALESEKAYYERELSKIVETRENTIAQLAVPILDEADSQIDTSEVISRIRAREKEGTNNG